MKANIFEIQHTEFSSEEFVISEPKYNLYKSEVGIWEFTISFNTSKALKRSPKLKDLVHAEPNFEATALMDPKDLKLETGKVITQKQGYDYERDEHLSNVYYFSHNSAEELEITIIEYHEDWIRS
ncbi:MAG: hypothetical protein AAF502_07215 [Bacteroidota bacterium]